MQNINIGKSGIQVPFLGMGTWAIGGGVWWGDNDDSLSVKAIQRKSGAFAVKTPLIFHLPFRIASAFATCSLVGVGTPSSG